MLDRLLDKLLDKTVSVSMVTLVLVILGCVGIRALPVGLIPDVDIPYVTVQVDAPDMSARELDEVVVRTLRQNLVQTDHLAGLHTESRDGSASIVLSFEQGHDIDFAFIEVNEKIDRSMSSLPDISRPKVFKASATDIPAFFINVTGRGEALQGDGFLELSDFVSSVIAKRLEQLDEVAMVDVSGVAEREILVLPDLEKLSAAGMSVDMFASSLADANVRLSNLTIRDGEYRYNVRFRSFASSPEDIGNVYFRSGDKVMQIRDVASVVEHAAPRSGLDRSDGKDAVMLAVIKQGEARMADLRSAINSLLDVFAQDYPDIEFTLTRDQTELLDYSINNLILNIIIAILLDCAIIFLFMKDLRSPLLVSLSIPVSLVISFFVFFLLGMTINIISLSGLLLGVGMMVDNTIVLTDNMTARWQRGEPLRDAVIKGTGEVSGAMLSSVLTTCAVFIPLIFLNGLAGDLFYDQAITVTVLLLVSYLVTVILLPVYYWVSYRRSGRFTPNRFLEKLSFGAALRVYDGGVNFFLRHRWLSWGVPLASAVIVAVCVSFMPKSKLPPISYSDAVLDIDWNEHISIDENRNRIIALEDFASERCSQISSMVGVQQFVLSHSGDLASNEASVYFKCADARTLEAMKREFASLIGGTWPDAVFGFSTSGNIFDMVFSDTEAELTARIRPGSGTVLTPSSLQPLLGDLSAALPRIGLPPISVKQDVLYVSDPELMSLYGVSRSELVSVLHSSLNGNRVFEIVQGGRSVPVVLGTDMVEMEDLFEHAVIDKPASDGRQAYSIPLKSLLRQTFDEDFKTIVSGEEGQYYPLSLDIPSSDVPETMATVRDVVSEHPGFDVGFSGAYFSNAQMMRQMVFVLLIALAMLFLILASQFESLIQPVIILSEIVIDLAFSLVVLWLTGTSINIMSLIGIVVVCGIVINDSILKIDTINRLVKEGWEIDDAIHEAGHRRLKAIIMTTLTTILSVAPFLSRGTIGDDLQYPMALVIIAGLTAGTVISLFYVPALYSVIYKKRRKSS